jgi:hypothetical protein
MRVFETGATRDDDTHKLDFEGFLSPLALEAFAEYMHKHRKQEDGRIRASDNWQRGICASVYMKSMWRHFFDVWKIHRGLTVVDPKTGKKVTLKEALCALFFNVQGMLHEELRGENEREQTMKGLFERVSIGVPFSSVFPSGFGGLTCPTCGAYKGEPHKKYCGDRE